jgi:hypothetical protein
MEKNELFSGVAPPLLYQGRSIETEKRMSNEL